MGLLDTFELGYATAPDGARIAYGVRPAPGPDILWLDPTYSFETVIESGGVAVWWEALAGLGRVIAVDLRGIGRSDPLPADFTLEQRLNDAILVLDAIGSRQVIAGGLMTGGSLALLFAALHPERVSSVVAAEAFARYLATDDYPFGLDSEQRARRAALLEQWGSGVFTTDGLTIDPITEPGILRYVGRIERNSASPGSARRVWELNCELDIRNVLPQVGVPVLVISHRGRGGRWRGAAADLARRLRQATYIEVGPEQDQVDSDVRREVPRFILGDVPEGWETRSLCAILVTDIVNSSDRTAALGDAMWRTLVEEHERVVSQQVERAGGRVVKFMGDGALAVIPLPSRALHCAHEILSCMRSSGLPIRAGLHLGEIDVRGDDVAGLAVNLAARVASAADSGEILVTGVVSGAVLGGGHQFSTAGIRVLKGIPGEWELFRAEVRQTVP